MYYIFLKTTSEVLFQSMISINYWNLIKIIKSPFQENRHFVFWGTFEGPLFLGLECSYSSGTDLWWIHSWIPYKNKFHSIIQVPVRHTFTYTARWHIKTIFWYSGGLKTCKAIKIARSIFLTITIPSHIHYEYERVNKSFSIHLQLCQFIK
jgi:hypothetical protein